MNTKDINLYYEDSKLIIKKSYKYSIYTREALYFSRYCEIYGNFTR